MWDGTKKTHHQRDGHVVIHVQHRQLPERAPQQEEQRVAILQELLCVIHPESARPAQRGARARHVKNGSVVAAERQLAVLGSIYAVTYHSTCDKPAPSALVSSVLHANGPGCFNL